MTNHCSVDGCDRFSVTSKGYCLLHYKRWKRSGNPLITKKAYRNLNPICSVDDCEKPTLCKGLCENHYALMRRNGEPVRTKVFTGEYIKDGYRYVMIGKRLYVPEHRLVMERFLGRKLAPDEHVHHIDGDTLNNSPSNLKIVTRAEHLSIHVQDRPRDWHGRFQ